MHIECLSEKIKYAVNLLEKISGRNLTLPILSALLIETGEGFITLRATNLNIGAEIRVPAKIITSGSVAVSASIIMQTLQGIQGDIPITLKLQNENIILQTKQAKLTVKSMQVDEFPTLPKIESSEKITLSTEVIISGIRSVVYAASNSDIKPELASIFIYTEKNTLVFVATDAFRLAEKKIVLKNNITIPEILFPAKNALEIIRIIENFSGEVEVTIGENQISFNQEGLYITSRLTPGSYPDYKKIIPTTTTTEIITLKSDIQTILKTLAIFSDKFNQMDISINPAEKKCILSCYSQETGEGVFEIEATLSGNALDTRINYRYLIDSFNAITSDSVAIAFTESNKPVVLRGVGDSSFTYLIMPMNR